MINYSLKKNFVTCGWSLVATETHLSNGAPTYQSCSRGNAPLWPSASRTRSSNCPVGSWLPRQGLESCPSGSWWQSPSCSLLELHPWGRCAPTSWRPERRCQVQSKVSQARPQMEPVVVVCRNLPVFILGEPLDHPFLLQAGQNGGCLLRSARHHVHIGGLALVHRPLHKVGHRGRQRRDGRQGAQAHPGSNTAMSERGNNQFKFSLV